MHKDVSLQCRSTAGQQACHKSKSTLLEMSTPSLLITGRDDSKAVKALHVIRKSENHKKLTKVMVSCKELLQAMPFSAVQVFVQSCILLCRLNPGPVALAMHGWPCSADGGWEWGNAVLVLCAAQVKVTDS